MHLADDKKLTFVSISFSDNMFITCLSDNSLINKNNKQALRLVLFDS